MHLHVNSVETRPRGVKHVHLLGFSSIEEGSLLERNEFDSGGQEGDHVTVVNIVLLASMDV